MLDKKLSLVDRKLSRVEGGIEVAKTSNNLQLLVLNIRQGFNANLLKALYMCKNQGFSSDKFESVSIFYTQYVQNIEKNQNVDLPSDRVNILQYISDNVKLEISDSFIYPDRMLDYLLGEALYGVDVHELWASEIKKLGLNKNQQLCVDTYQNYWDILNSTSNKSENIERANVLFEKRKNDAYYQGADQTEGGGEDNGFVVDYRLLAIKKKRGI